MDILRIMVLRGPSIWTYKPVLEAWVDLGVLEDYPSNKLPGFPERLEAWLPTLIEHRCTIGERGGFLKRVHDGTWCGHILEHVTLELLSLCGRPAGFGRARDHERRGTYKVVVSCPEETLTRACLATAHALIRAAIDDTLFDVAARVAELKTIADTHAPRPDELPFDKESAASLPITFVTGTSGRAEVARVLERLLLADGRSVGVASADGLRVEGHTLRQGPATSWRDARELLFQSGLEAAVCDVPPLTIASEGIAFERCRVGVVTRLEEAPELVPYFLADAEQRFKVGRCAVDLVVPEGAAVLNAADAQVADLARLCDGEVVFFGLEPDHPVLAAHRAAGKRAVSLCGPQIVLLSGDTEQPIGPLAAFQVRGPDGATGDPEATLAGVAAAWAQGVSADVLNRVLPS
jgi:cyanophycin synthetase